MASIRQRPNGTHSVLWRDPKAHKQRSLTFPTRSAAIQFQTVLEANGHSLIEATEAQRRLTTTAPTVSALVRQHITTNPSTSERTRMDYLGQAARHIDPHLGHITANRLNRQDIKGWLTALASSSLADKTIANIHGLLSAALNTALEDGLIEINPCRGMRLPRRSDHQSVQPVFLTPQQWQTLLARIHPHYKPFFAMLAATGARFSEITALTVADVDLTETPAIRINKSRRRNAAGKFFVGPTKTKRSMRTVSLPKNVIAQLRPLLQEKGPSDNIFTAVQGGPIQNHTIHNRIWKPAIISAQIGATPRIHDIRHSHASWLINAGVELLTIQRRLGHESIVTTMNTYGHLSELQKSAAAEAIDQMLY